MAFAEVGAGSQRASAASTAEVASLAVAFPANVGNGNLLIVAGAIQRGLGVGTVTIADTRGSSYTVVHGTILGAYRVFIGWALAASAGANTVTVTPNVDHFVSFGIDEFSGPNATPASVNGGTSTGTSTTPSDDITTAVADELLIGVMSHADSTEPTLTPGASYTQIAENELAFTSWAFNAEFRIVTTAQAYTVDWTVGVSVEWTAQTHSFKPSVAAAGWGTLLGGERNRLVVAA